MRSFVIANGTSRKNFDLNLLKDKGKTYGCNALYRDFAPDYIGCIDSPMFEEMVREGAWQFSKMIAKHKYEGALKLFPRARIYIQTFKDALGYDRHYDTGQTMLDYASIHLKEGEIYLLGFDLTSYMVENQRVHQNKIDNIYAGTDCYASLDAVEKYSGKWVRQMRTIFNNNPNITYYRIGSTIIPETFTTIDNLKHLTYDEFMERL